MLPNFFLRPQDLKIYLMLLLYLIYIWSQNISNGQAYLIIYFMMFAQCHTKPYRINFLVPICPPGWLLSRRQIYPVIRRDQMHPNTHNTDNFCFHSSPRKKKRSCFSSYESSLCVVPPRVSCKCFSPPPVGKGEGEDLGKCVCRGLTEEEGWEF